MICIVDYGAGNLASVKNILKKVGADSAIISNKKEDILTASKIILPGVGKFDYGMQHLINSGLIEVLEQRVLGDKVPFLGICLGAQLITKGSEEGELPGLGWVAGRTVSFKNRISSDLKIPHMGWNTVTVRNKNELLGIADSDNRYYFVHSYFLDMEDKDCVWLTSTYGIEFCAAYHLDNIYACQFHPEKSHKFGMRLMEKFIALK